MQDNTPELNMHQFFLIYLRWWSMENWPKQIFVVGFPLNEETENI